MSSSPVAASHNLSPVVRIAEIERVLSATYEAGHVVGADGRSIAAFPSGMTREAGEALARIVQDERAATTIETGMALGLSTLWMVRGALASGSTAPRHVAVDPLQTKDWRSAGLRLAAAAGIGDCVTHVADDSTLALPRMVAERSRFDLMLVDGGHRYEHAFCDVFFGARLVKPGGLIVVDDVWMPAVQTAVNYFTSNGLLALEERSELPAARRFALLRVPVKPPERAWDAFVPFEIAARKP